MTGTFWVMMCLGPRSYWGSWGQCGRSTGITGTLGCLWELWYTPSRVNTGVTGSSVGLLGVTGSSS